MSQGEAWSGQSFSDKKTPEMDRRGPLTEPLRRRFPCAVIALVALGLIGSSLVGCGVAGPCVHVYRDAVVHVSAVVDSTSGADIDSVFITDVMVNGSSLPLYLAAYGGGHEAGILLDGDTLRCSTPCAFGAMDGRWQVTLLARGYPLQTVAFDAHYATGHGGCPSYSDRGTLVVLRLTRTPGAQGTCSDLERR